jgi:hypothetical protein
MVVLWKLMRAAGAEAAAVPGTTALTMGSFVQTVGTPTGRGVTAAVGVAQVGVTPAAVEGGWLAVACGTLAAHGAVGGKAGVPDKRAPGVEEAPTVLPAAAVTAVTVVPDIAAATRLGTLSEGVSAASVGAAGVLFEGPFAVGATTDVRADAFATIPLIGAGKAAAGAVLCNTDCDDPVEAEELLFARLSTLEEAETTGEAAIR